MAQDNNFGFANMPKIIEYAGGKRRAITMTAKSSSVHWMGGFVGIISGAEAGVEFGVNTYTDDYYVYGLTTGIFAANGMPIQEFANRNGTITNATSFAPLKYTFAATNDEASTTSAKLEYLEVMPILPGDILEVVLSNDAGTAVAARGTTTVAGTTTSTANFGVCLEVNSSAPFTLKESTGVLASANMDFITVSDRRWHPLNPNAVYVQVIRSALTINAAD